MTDRYFESLTTLTNQQDVDSLQKCFLALLAELFPISYAGNFVPEVRGGLLRVREDLSLFRQGDEQYIKTLRNYELVQPEPLIEKCAQDWRPKYVCEEIGPMLCYLPVKFDDKLHSIIKLECEKLSVGDLDYLLQITQIYTNFLKVIIASTYDSLTGLMNRNTLDMHFKNLLQRQMAQQQEQSDQYQEIDKRRGGKHTAVSLALIDIDQFKMINDRYGHMFGDEILLQVSQLMQESFRQNDLLFRYGGEEFLVLLEPTFLADIHGVLDRFRQKIEETDFPKVGRITASIGYTLVNTMENSAIYVGQADNALFYAKENGGNSVFAFDTLVETGVLKTLPRDSAADWY